MLITAYSPNSEPLFTYMQSFTYIAAYLFRVNITFSRRIKVWSSQRHDHTGKLQRCIKFSVEEYLHVKVENMFVGVDELLMEVSN